MHAGLLRVRLGLSTRITSTAVPRLCVCVSDSSQVWMMPKYLEQIVKYCGNIKPVLSLTRLVERPFITISLLLCMFDINLFPVAVLCSPSFLCLLCFLT